LPTLAWRFNKTRSSSSWKDVTLWWECTWARPIAGPDVLGTALPP
jgi:hypothetical protein